MRREKSYPHIHTYQQKERRKKSSKKKKKEKITTTNLSTIFRTTQTDVQLLMSSLENKANQVRCY
ncbi:MAG: hypothetical protein ACE5FF_18605, partial [Saprospiraceae bacterium]